MCYISRVAKTHTGKGVKQNMKTIIYVRGKNTTRQIEKCEEYAMENNLDIIGTVNTENELSAFVFSGNINGVLVSDATRIARRRNEYITAEKMFNEFGVKLFAVESGLL